MPFGPSDLIWIGVVPCVAAALTMWACNRLDARPSAAWAASVAAGLVVGMVGLNVRVDWQTALEKLLRPRVASDWLLWLVLVAAGITLLAAYAPRSWQRWPAALACVFAIALPLRLLATNAAMNRWSAGEKLGVLVLWSAAIAAGWLTLALESRNGEPLTRGVLLVLVAAGIAITVSASGALVLGELGGVAAAALLGATGSASVLRQLGDGPSGAAGPVAVMLGGILLIAHHYSELSATNAALLATSLAAAGWLPIAKLPLPLGKGWGEGVLRAAICLVPMAIAVATAVSATLADASG